MPLPSLAQLSQDIAEKRPRRDDTESESDVDPLTSRYYDPGYGRIPATFTSKDVSIIGTHTWENGNFRNEINDRQRKKSELMELYTDGSGSYGQDTFEFVEREHPGFALIRTYIDSKAEAIKSLASHITEVFPNNTITITSVTEWIHGSYDGLDMLQEEVVLQASVDRSKDAETGYIDQMLDLLGQWTHEAVILSECEREQLRKACSDDQ